MLKLTKNTRKYHGFTLVELIVVITILVILGTIAFISLGGYSLSARDSARISDITNITKALEITLLKNGSVIPPDKGDTGIITITASGTTIGYQGYAASTVLSNIKMSEARDPLDKKYYTYLTNANYTKYQILTLLENSSTLTQNNTNSNFPLLDTAFAGYETRIPSTKGSSLGVLLGNTGTLLNQPVQESYNVSSFTGVDVVNTNSGYIIYMNKSQQFSGTGTALKAGIVGDGLVGYWSFDDGAGTMAYDKSGNGNNGILSGATLPSWTTGSAGGGLFFNGINSFVDIGNPSIAQITQSITTSAWIKTSYGNAPIINKGIWATDDGYIVYLSGLGKARLSVDNGINPRAVAESPSAINDNQWHFLVGTYLPYSYVKLYIDGVLVATTTIGVPSSIANISSTTLRFGKNDNDTRFFSGSLDEIRIYNRALSDSEVQTLYNATK